MQYAVNSGKSVHATGRNTVDGTAVYFAARGEGQLHSRFQVVLRARAARLALADEVSNAVLYYLQPGT